MILIADSGSTKTDWVAIDQFQKETAYLSAGINPFFVSVDDVYSVVRKTFELADISDKVKKLFFYGTGCIKNHNTNIVLDGLKRFFTNAEIFVEDDMIGAARSIFGNKSGIACILGTGANSGKYNGSEFTEKIPTLGYVLGDEASGAYFGKILINNYFKKIMPEDLSIRFKNTYNLEVGDVLNKVYKQAFPNRYLAKFTYFLSDNIEHPYSINLLKSGFEAFIQNNFAKYVDYKSYPVGFVGSIAFNFSSILKNTCESSGIVVEHIIEKPIKRLVQYHTIDN